MEKLIELVAKNVGISNEQAEAAIKVIVEYLKEMVEEPCGVEIEGAFRAGG